MLKLVLTVTATVSVLLLLVKLTKKLSSTLQCTLQRLSLSSLTPEDVPADVVEKEKAIQVAIAVESGKPQEIAEKMVVGRMKKFTGEVSLTGQAFIMDPSQTVGAMLKAKGATVTNFIRLEVGEGIEKAQEMSFAEEVAAVQKG